MGDSRAAFPLAANPEVIECGGFFDFRRGRLTIPRTGDVPFDVEIATPVFRVVIDEQSREYRCTSDMFEVFRCADPNHLQLKMRGNVSIRLLKGPKPYRVFCTKWNGQQFDRLDEDAVDNTLPDPLWHCENRMQESILSEIVLWIQYLLVPKSIALELPAPFEGKCLTFPPINRPDQTVLCGVCFETYNRNSQQHFCDVRRDPETGKAFVLPRDNLRMEIALNPAVAITKLMDIPRECREPFAKLLSLVAQMSDGRGKDDAGQQKFLSAAATLHAELAASKFREKRKRDSSPEIPAKK